MLFVLTVTKKVLGFGFYLPAASQALKTLKRGEQRGGRKEGGTIWKGTKVSYDEPKEANINPT